jgi:DnaJ-class molecular chaperone
MFFHPPSQQKNFYEILGVEPNSTESDIKNAYRKLSLKYHPDRNKSAEAQGIFQELGLAYETLGDADKKRQYDLEQQGPSEDINNLINMMFRGQMPHFANRMDSGPGIQIFRMDGHGRPPQGFDNFFHNLPEKPERIQKQINITIEQAYIGCNIPVEIERVLVRGEERTKENETIYVNIPPGIDTNETIILQDKGHCVNDVVKGDVRLVINVINNTPFQRNGLELHFKKTISLKEALLGFTFDLQHLNGKIFTFNNTAQIICPQFKRRLPDLGMIRDNNRGNLWIEFNIQFPETLTEEQITALKDIL